MATTNNKNVQVVDSLTRDERTYLENGHEVALGTDGYMYELLPDHKCRRLYPTDKAPKTEVTAEEIAVLAELKPNQVLRKYQTALKKKFPDEECPIKDGKFVFKGYKVSLSTENGFLIEDSFNDYKSIKGKWDLFPTPAELVAFLTEKVTHKGEERKMTLAEYNEAVKRGKAAQEARKYVPKEVVEEKPVNYEKLRKQTLKTIEKLREDRNAIDLNDLIVMIPFKRWRRKAKALLKQLNEKAIRRGKFLNTLQEVTEQETFVVEEKNHRSTFRGTCMPVYEKVGNLVGDKLEVDGKLIDAVPFLTEWLLCEEPRVMSQYMKYSRKEITQQQFINEPIKVDWKEDYKPSKMLPNTAENANLLSIIFNAVGLIAPQDLLYETTLKVGDVILLWDDVSCKFLRRTVAKVKGGVEVGREVGLFKWDKFIMAPKKEKK